MGHAGPNRGLDPPIQDPARKPITARALIRQRSAHPRLQIAHVPYEFGPPGPAYALQLTDRFAQPVHAIGHLLQAVLEGGPLSRLQPGKFGQFCHECLCRLGPVHAHG